MSERSLESCIYDDPSAYYVNTVRELSPEVVYAHITREDLDKKRQLLNVEEKYLYDIFICVNHGWHGFVLVVPCPDPTTYYRHLIYNQIYFTEDYGRILRLQGDFFCWKFELCSEDARKRMYKISMSEKLFKDIQKTTRRSYYIGRYTDVPLNGLQFAALQAAPHRYETLLDDCVGFAKEYCVALLSYCSNGLEIEKEVKSNIKKATESGFSVEKLRFRQSYLFGWMGNFSFGGADVTSFLGGRHTGLTLCLGFLFVIVALSVDFVLAKRYQYM